MLTLSHLKPTDYRIQLWKNARGETTEIAVDTLSPFRWRLSSAKLSEPGPFSSYAGYDRILVLMNGGPVTVSHREKRGRKLGTYTPYSFKGDWETSAVLESPGMDFNIFTLSGKAKAGAYPTFIKQKEDIQFPIAGNEHFIFCAEGEIEVLDQNTGKAFALHAKDTLRVSRSSTKEFLNLRARGTAPSSTCLWIVIHLIGD